MRPANERWCYSVTPSLIRWAQTQNDPWLQEQRLDIFLFISRIIKYDLNNPDRKHKIINEDCYVNPVKARAVMLMAFLFQWCYNCDRTAWIYQYHLYKSYPKKSNWRHHCLRYSHRNIPTSPFASTQSWTQYSSVVEDSVSGGHIRSYSQESYAVKNYFQMDY